MADDRIEVTADIGKVLAITQQRLTQALQDNIILECVISQQAEEIEALKKNKENANG